MKRSEQIILGAAGLIIVAAFWPKTETPEETTQALVFGSPTECKNSGAITATECDTQWSRAAEQQLATAPKFERSADCETTYGTGQCRESRWNGASVFVPTMVGFMLARQFGASGPQVVQPLFPAGAQASACPPGADPALRPDCAASRSGGGSSSSSRSSGSSSRAFTTSSGKLVVAGSRTGTSTGTSTVPRSATSSPSVNTHVASRGGFGSSAHGFSIGG